MYVYIYLKSIFKLNSSWWTVHNWLWKIENRLW